MIKGVCIEEIRRVLWSIEAHQSLLIHIHCNSSGCYAEPIHSLWSFSPAHFTPRTDASLSIKPTKKKWLYDEGASRGLKTLSIKERMGIVAEGAPWGFTIILLEPTINVWYLPRKNSQRWKTSNYTRKGGFLGSPLSLKDLAKIWEKISDAEWQWVLANVSEAFRRTRNVPTKDTIFSPRDPGKFLFLNVK